VEDHCWIGCALHHKPVLCAKSMVCARLSHARQRYKDDFVSRGAAGFIHDDCGQRLDGPFCERLEVNPDKHITRLTTKNMHDSRDSFTHL